ncbi:SseB family protein [Boseongicola aestuarii]|uniref:SseB family protein n=1 Tax=Boseongicola aestuarii TaxID=1470561 RepID=UPI000BB451C5|nr:SseB family protein [Boseongicola aestuarii]
MTESDQGNGASKSDVGVFRSHRSSRVIVTAEEEPGLTATDAPRTPAEVSEKYATILGSTYAATFDGGEAELWQFYETLAEARIFVLLDDTAKGETYEPKVFTLKDAQYLLAFDVPEQADELTGSTASTSPTLGMDLFKLLRGRDIGLGINMGGTSSATLISGETIEMICAYYDGEAGEPLVADADTSQFRALLAPQNFPDTLQNALSDMLFRLQQTFNKAVLLKAEYEEGKSGFIVAVSGAADPDRGAIAAAVEDALKASRRNDVQLDVAFLGLDDPMASRIERVGQVLTAKRRS